jgi:YfiH family protein
MAAIGWEAADWHAPPGVHAGVTSRVGGVSRGPFASFNLASHVGDEVAAVGANRAHLVAALALPAEPLWLNQVHGNAVVVHGATGPAPTADAAVTFERGRVLAVLTADCLSVVLAARDGSRLGLAHAGWRGLAAGVIDATILALAVPPASLVAWLGPAIGPAAFEVGDEVRTAFVGPDPGAAEAFTPNARGRWQADLVRLARRRMTALGVTDINGTPACTAANPARYYSYRRATPTGRMATLAWLGAARAVG